MAARVVGPDEVRVDGEETVRVTVVSDAVGVLTSAAAGQALAAGWSSARVIVVPAGTAGKGFVSAAAALLDATPRSTACGAGVFTMARTRDEAVLGLEGAAGAAAGVPLHVSSTALGSALAATLDGGPPLRRVLLDLTGPAVHDGGAGLLGALGATADVALDVGVAGLDGLTRLDLDAARRRLGATELVGVVPASELAQPLLGLRGITSLHGRAAGLDAAVLLRTDAALERLAALASPGHAPGPGAGACGGMGLAVLALGGRLSTGPALSLETPAAEAALRGVDLVVSGCTVFDFAHRGGGVVAAAAAAASGVLAPCVVVAGEVVIGAREMRTLGIEAAYAVRETNLDAPTGGDVDAAELTATARRVARSWSW